MDNFTPEKIFQRAYLSAAHDSQELEKMGKVVVIYQFITGLYIKAKLSDCDGILVPGIPSAHSVQWQYTVVKEVLNNTVVILHGVKPAPHKSCEYIVNINTTTIVLVERASVEALWYGV